MLVLSRADVESLLEIDPLIEALAEAMDDLSAGRASVPQRNFAFVEDRGGILAAMPAHLPSAGVLESKLVAVFQSNASLGLATHQALIACFDPSTGEPVAVMDGSHITAVRTAAGSALATRLLAREDTPVLAILGTGVQARSHAAALQRVRAFQEIRVAGRTPAHVKSFADEVGAVPSESWADAVGGADVVCACTHSDEPVVRREWLREGTHVTSVGFTPGAEVDADTVAGAVVAVESRAAALGSHPDGAAELDGIDPGRVIEIGELVAGSRPGRTSRDQITLYKSVGVAVQDAAAASLVLRAARERGMGAEVAF